MRIVALAIYNASGEPRVVRFGPGLNVVTGWSGTGKSSLLEIADFCLGRTHPSYPAGVLTRAVRWFAIELEHDGARLVVARPAPAEGATSVQTALFEIGASIDDLTPDRLTANADATRVRSELSRILEIPPNQVRPETLMAPPLGATISQALLLCFQGQGEIANKNQLFHRADVREIQDAIRSTLPFFVGAIDVDTAVLRRELDQQRAELRKAEARLGRARLMESRFVEGASSLLAEAAVLGLAEPISNTESSRTLPELRRIAQQEADVSSEPGSSDGVLAPLRDRQRALVEQLDALEHRLGVIKRTTNERTDFGNELEEQRNRLVSIGIVPPMPDGDEPGCPICGHVIEEDHVTVGEIRAGLAELDRHLEGLRGVQPAALAARHDFEAAVAEVREALRMVTADISAATSAGEGLVRSGDLRERRSFLRGRITEFLNSLPQSESTIANLEQEVFRRTQSANELEERLDPQTYRERTDSIFRVISSDVGAWARGLRLEYSEGWVQIDPHALTVIADRRDGPVELARMGSAANFIGYHVAAHLALHKWFIEKRAPVPNFLILDQPSQAFYPDDVRGAADERISDEDRERVEALYALIRDVIAQLDDRLQVIVLDHANLDLDWFQSAVVANWRDGEALVPRHWLDEEPNQSE